MMIDITAEEFVQENDAEIFHHMCVIFLTHFQNNVHNLSDWDKYDDFAPSVKATAHSEISDWKVYYEFNFVDFLRDRVWDTAPRLVPDIAKMCGHKICIGGLVSKRPFDGSYSFDNKREWHCMLYPEYGSVDSWYYDEKIAPYKIAMMHRWFDEIKRNATLAKMRN